MKNRSINMLIVALLLLGAFAVAINVFLGIAKRDFPKYITVSANGVTESILPIRDLQLNPAESKEYTVNLVCAASGSYYIYLAFEEEEDGGMKNFVDVTVFAGETQVYSGALAELIEGKLIEFEGVLQEKDPLPVTLRYEMPYETGNEAQGTYADFNVRLKIKKS